MGDQALEMHLGCNGSCQVETSISCSSLRVRVLSDYSIARGTGSQRRAVFPAICCPWLASVLRADGRGSLPPTRLLHARTDEISKLRAEHERAEAECTCRWQAEDEYPQYMQHVCSRVCRKLSWRVDTCLIGYMYVYR